MRIFLNLFFIACISFLSSCDNLTEEIHINADGSGKYAFYSDMIPGLTMMMEGMGSLFADSLSEQASPEELLNESIWKDFPDVIDSVIHYSEFVPDSVIPDKETKELVQKMEFFMEGGRSKGYVNTGFRYPFPNFSDLQRMLKKVEENQQSSGAGGGLMPGLEEMKTEINYEMTENSVTRRTVFLKAPDLKDTDMEMLKMFMTDARMRTIVHLPRNVKDVKGAGIKEVKGATVTFEYDMLDYMIGKVSGDFNVVMED